MDRKLLTSDVVFQDLVLTGMMLIVQMHNKARTEQMENQLKDNLATWVMQILAFKETPEDKES